MKWTFVKLVVKKCCQIDHSVCCVWSLIYSEYFLLFLALPWCYLFNTIIRECCSHLCQRETLILAPVLLLIIINLFIYVLPLRRLHGVQLEQLVRWKRKGFFQREFATRLNVSQSVVSRVRNWFVETRTAEYTHGGEQDTRQPQDRLIVLNTTRNPTFTASSTHRSFRQATQLVISGQTMVA